MTITRYARRTPFHSPWLEVEDMSNRLHRLFSEPSSGDGTRLSAWSPTVGVEETDDELLLTAEIPGMSIEDIEIHVENNVLTLTGEKRDVREGNEDPRYHLWERKHGSFNRTFSLPRTVKADKITATLKDGILVIQMPKAPEAKSRKISVSSQS